MPDLQQHQAAAASARSRITARLVRELSACRPLTADQRAALIEAAECIEVVPA